MILLNLHQVAHCRKRCRSSTKAAAESGITIAARRLEPIWEYRSTPTGKRIDPGQHQPGLRSKDVTPSGIAGVHGWALTLQSARLGAIQPASSSEPDFTKKTPGMASTWL